MSDPEQPPPGESGGNRTGRGKRAIPLSEYDRIGKWKCQGWTNQKIADIYGVSEKTIRLIYKDEILPLVKYSPSRSVEAELLRLETLEALAWEKLTSGAPAETVETMREELEKGGERGQASHRVIERVTQKIVGRGEVAWANLILNIIKTRADFEGHEKPKRLIIEADTEFRIGGQDPDETHAEMLAYIRAEMIATAVREARLRGENVVEGKLLEPPAESGP